MLYQDRAPAHVTRLDYLKRSRAAAGQLPIAQRHMEQRDRPRRADHAHGVGDTPLGSGDELVPDHLPEATELLAGEPASIAGGPLRLLKPQLQRAVAGLTLKVGKELAGALEGLCTASRDVVLRLLSAT